jgi:hypothetical protein
MFAGGLAALLGLGTGVPGTVHVALVVNAGSGAAVTAAQLTAAQAELTAWSGRLFS